MVHKLSKEIFSWGKAIIIALSITIFISIFVFQPYTVSGGSMEPTLDGKDLFDEEKIGDRVMVFKSSYLFGGDPEYGDLVIIDSHIEKHRTLKDEVMDSPLISWLLNGERETDKFWIKRVIGEAGDKLEFIDGKVYRNGNELEENYIKEEMEFAFESIVVPEDHIFVMGDNRNDSYDSREIGPVPTDNVVGKVFLRYYPLNKISKY